MPICGPKLSVCCSILSVWGILMLVLMGIFFYARSIALIDDLHLREHMEDNKEDLDKYNAELDSHFTRAAYHCWIAALLYVVSLAASIHQFFANRRSTYSM